MNKFIDDRYYLNSLSVSGRFVEDTLRAGMGQRYAFKVPLEKNRNL